MPGYENHQGLEQISGMRYKAQGAGHKEKEGVLEYSKKLTAVD
jgi:hypothetical protein